MQTTGSVTSDGIYARIAIRPEQTCPLRVVSEAVPVVQFVPGGRSVEHPQVVVETPERPDDVDVSGVNEVVRIGDRTVYRLSGDAVCEEVDGACRICGFGFLPVEPLDARWRDGWLHLTVAAGTYTELRETIEHFDPARYDVDLRQVVPGAWPSEGAVDERSAVVDLQSVTPRQREVARVAVEMGYFEPDGASAEDVAAELDITKSTLSRHLRIVTVKVLSQLFDDVDLERTPP